MPETIELAQTSSPQEPLRFGPERSSRSRRRDGLISLCAAVVLAALLFGYAGASHFPRRRLPDGTWLELRAWKSGIDPKLEERGGWWRLAPRSLVGPSLVYNPNPVGTVRSQTPMLHLLVARTGKKQLLSQAYGAITDEHGCWFEPRISDRGVSRAGDFEVLRFTSLPADSQRLTLGFHDSYARAPVAEFASPLRPPSGASRAVGPPVPLPASVSDRGVTFTLTSLKHRNQGMHYREAAEFRVSRNGIRELGWRPVSVKVADSSGAEVTSARGGYPLHFDGNAEFRFSGLCRMSEAWEVKVTFRREKPVREEDRTVTFIVKP